MHPIKEIGRKKKLVTNSSNRRVGLFFRYCRINFLALACFPLFVHATLSTQLKDVMGATETANLSGHENKRLSNGKLSIGSSFEKDGLSPTLMGNTKKWDKESNTMRGLLLNDRIDESLKENITQAQTAVSSKNSASTTTSENNAPFTNTKGSITERIRSLAIMLSVIAIPPALVVGLLFYKVHRRNKRYAHRHVDNAHSWQS